MIKNIENALYNEYGIDSYFYEDESVYKEHVFSSEEDEINYIKENCYVFFDEKYAYIVEEDDDGDYAVFKMDKKDCLVGEEYGFVSNFEPYSVYYMVKYVANPEVWFKGYVSVPYNNCYDENLDWYGWDGTQYQYGGGKIIHNGIKIGGATEKQKEEIEDFRVILDRDCGWRDEFIPQQDAGEATCDRGDYILLINMD